MPIRSALVVLVALAAAGVGGSLRLPAAGPSESRAGGLSDTDRRGEAYYHLMRATFAARAGKVREAAAEIRQASKIEPESAALRAESASLLLSIGLQNDAERFARDALTLDAEEPTAMRLIADLAASRALGNPKDIESRDEAIRMYTLLARSPETDDDTLRILARLKFRSGDVDGAIDVVRRLADNRKGDVAVVLMIVNMLKREGRQPEALEELLNFMARYGEEDTLIPQVSELADETDQWEAVEQIVGRMLDSSPDSSSLLKLHGEALIRLARFEDAAVPLERALELSGDDPVLLYQLTSAYGSLGRLADASSSARALARALPDNPTVQTVLGDSLAAQRDIDAALEALGAALSGFSDSEDSERRDVVRRRMMALYLDQERFEEAARVAREFEKPGEPDSLELQIRLAISERKLDEARALLQRLRTRKDNGGAALFDGELLVLEGRIARARAKFKEAAADLGSTAWARIGEIWFRAEQPAEGARAVRMWARLEPDNPDAHFAVGGFLERAGDFEAAEPELRRALELDPDHANALNYLGYSLAYRNERLPEALELITRALEIDPWNGAYLDSLGWVYYRMGRYLEAREPMERAVREYPLDSTVLDHLGDVYARLGEHDLALEMWRRALAAQPDDPDAVRVKIEAGLDDRAGSRSENLSGARSIDPGPPEPRQAPRTR